MQLIRCAHSLKVCKFMFFGTPKNPRFLPVFKSTPVPVKPSPPYSIRRGLKKIGSWIKQDPPRAAQTALAAYALYAGYQGGYIPLDAIYHGTRAWDRPQPRRKKFRLTRGFIRPSKRYLRRQQYRRRWLPYWEWKEKQQYHFKKPLRRTKFYYSFTAPGHYHRTKRRKYFAGKHIVHDTPYRW